MCRLTVIEDAAHGLPARYKGRAIGSRGNPVAFSFYATKNLTTGEGGMVTCHDESIAERLRLLCLHGISKDAWNRYSDRGNWFYDVTESGFKYNLSDIQSAIGIHQLRKQERFIAARASYAEQYNEAFEDVAEIELPPTSDRCRHSWHLYSVRLNLDQLEVTRDQFIHELRRKNVCASVHFIPIPLMQFFAQYVGLEHNHCPRALELYPRLVSLPLYPAMTAAQVRHVIDSVKDIVATFRKARVFSVCGD